MTDDGSASYLAPMRRWLFVFVLASPALPAVASAAAGRPPWLERAARLAAARLSDGTVSTSITYLAPRSRFPRVVLTGSFVCNACSRPSNATPGPRGTIAELRFDGDTHLSRDFALCRSRAQCDASLCSFGACTRAQDALDAAFAAFDASLRGIPGDPDPFTHRTGTFSCHIHYPRREMRYIIGSSSSRTLTTAFPTSSDVRRAPPEVTRHDRAGREDRRGLQTDPAHPHGRAEVAIGRSCNGSRIR